MILLALMSGTNGLHTFCEIVITCNIMGKQNTKNRYTCILCHVIDKKNLSKNQPISLLEQVYKLFMARELLAIMRVLKNRINSRLDEHLSPREAAVSKIIENTNKYQIPLNKAL